MRNFTSVFVALITFLSIGCQSSMPPASLDTAAPQRAVVVTAGNGGSTTVFLPSADPANPVMLSTAGADVCPDCKAAAVKYFQTGVLDPKCARTGATRMATTLINPNLGHQ